MDRDAAGMVRSTSRARLCRHANGYGPVGRKVTQNETIPVTPGFQCSFHGVLPCVLDMTASFANDAFFENCCRNKRRLPKSGRPGWTDDQPTIASI